MNRKTLSPQRSSDFKIFAKKIIKKALESVDPSQLVLKNINLKKNSLQIQKKSFDLTQFRKIHTIGAGKGSGYMFLGLKKILDQKIDGGVIISLSGTSLKDNIVDFFYGSHPIPTKDNIRASKKLIDYIGKKINRDDLVLFLITGGASVLLLKPSLGINFKEKLLLNKLLISSGANIREINCVRKHMSAIKGGKLAEIIYPAKLITLLISDIVDSPFEDIGSGPTIGNSSTFTDAYQVLEKYNIAKRLNPSLKNHFLKGIEKKISETPHPDSDIFSNNHNFLLGDNVIFLEAAKKNAKKMGINSHVFTAKDQGDTAEISHKYALVIKKIIKGSHKLKPPVLLLSGGELTVQVKGKGKGGRNQQFVLHLLKELKNITHPFYASSIGTDGIDGPTDAAGAWITEKTIQKVKRMNLNLDYYLNNNDSYHFFQKINQLIITGPTRTNVMDFRIFFIPVSNNSKILGFNQF